MVAVQPLIRPTLGAGGLAAAGGAAAALSAAGGDQLIAVAVLAVFGVLALWRFEAFVLAILVARPVLDGLPGLGGGVLEPTAALGWLFVCAAAAWLLLQPGPPPAPACPSLAPAWVGLAAVAVVSAAVAASPGPALDEAARFASVALMVPVVNRLVTDRAALARLVAVLLLAAVVPVLVALAQASTGDGAVFVDGILRARGTFRHPNSLGVFCVFVIAVGLATTLRIRGWARVGSATVTGLTVVALVATYARGAWIGAAVAAGAVVALLARRTLPALALGLAALAAVAPSVGDRVAQAGEDRFISGEAGNSLVWRFDYWRRIVPLATERPVLGLGPGAVERRLPEAKAPHNDPLRIVTELGLAGAAAYGAVVAGMGLTARRAWAAAHRPLERTVAAAAIAAVAAFALLSLVSNLISQAVVLWELAALVAAAGAVPRLGRLSPAALPVPAGAAR